MRIQDILREIGMTGKELALELGINYAWYRRATMRSKKVKPNWVKAFELGYGYGNNKVTFDSSLWGDVNPVDSSLKAIENAKKRLGEKKSDPSGQSVGSSLRGGGPGFGLLAACDGLCKIEATVNAKEECVKCGEILKQ